MDDKKARPRLESIAFRAALLLGLSPVIRTELFVLLASYKAELSKPDPSCKPVVWVFPEIIDSYCLLGKNC
jgi:hypothetical protein